MQYSEFSYNAGAVQFIPVQCSFNIVNPIAIKVQYSTSQYNVVVVHCINVVMKEHYSEFQYNSYAVQ